jgi:hypothetical protein
MFSEVGLNFVGMVLALNMEIATWMGLWWSRLELRSWMLWESVVMLLDELLEAMTESGLEGEGAEAGLGGFGGFKEG